jgi:hypothetical protein
MKSTHAWGWFAAGVVALGLNGVYHDYGAPCAHRTLEKLMERIVEPSRSVIALASDHADWFMAKSGIVAARTETAACRLGSTRMHLQTKVGRNRIETSRFERISAREEMAIARMEANRVRIQEQVEEHLARMRPVRVFDSSMCRRVRVNVPHIEGSAPGVHIENVSAQID